MRYVVLIPSHATSFMCFESMPLDESPTRHCKWNKFNVRPSWFNTLPEVVYSIYACIHILMSVSISFKYSCLWMRPKPFPLPDLIVHTPVSFCLLRLTTQQFRCYTPAHPPAKASKSNGKRSVRT